MKKNSSCNLEFCLMCRHTLPEWHAAIGNHKRNFVAKKGEVIIKEGEPVTGVYFVTSGNVKVHKHWGDKELIIRFANDGAIFGHRGISTANNSYPISATALETTSLCYVDIEFFKTTLKVNHDFAYSLLMSVKSRLAVAILNLKAQFGLSSEGFLNLALSRQDLAAYTGATYETVFRTMNELLAEELIHVKDKMIGILDETKLQDLSNK